jgi:5'-nucleotidase
MGNLVSDAILDRVKGQGVEIVFQNGGGLRASIDQGVVTMGEVLTVLPFQNTLATFQITGKDVVDALENGVSQIEDGAGRFAQVAGLKYSFDKSQPAGGRVKDVQVMENGAWAPIDPGKTYLAATNNYVRQGGDGYKVFARNAQNAYDYGPGLEQVVADYLAAHRPYKPHLDGRITEIGTATAQAETAPAGTAPAAGAANAPKPDNAAPATAEPNAQPEAPAAQGGTATETKPAEAATTPSSHVIVAGDTYWDLAKTYYKDGAKWHEIADANPGDKPRFLPVGKTLTIPAAK